MAGEQILLDPTAEATGTQLDVSDTTAGYNLLAHDYPQPENDPQWASSADTEGERKASTRPKNRVITATVRCLQPTGGTPSIGTLVKQLQQKIGKLDREGGTYRRVLPSGDTITFDVEAAAIKVPADKRWITRQVADVEMTFTCKPYGRGAEADLGDNVETTLPVLIFTDTGIKGDVPGLGRLVIDNDDAVNAQGLLRWGLQSRYYSSASTAALFYQGESCALLNATASAGPAGASGSGNNTALQSSLTTGTWLSLIALGASATAQTHIGTFRVMARVRAPFANAGIVSARISWAPVVGADLVTNAEITLIPADEWLLVDLGQVTLPKVKTGTQGWLGTLDARSTVFLDDLYIDWIAFIPVDEGSGENSDKGPSGIAGSEGATIRHDGAFANKAGGYGPPLKYYEGDYLLIPPSGVENRTVRVIVKFARGGLTDAIYRFGDPAADDISAHLFYTPRYLVVPEP